MEALGAADVEGVAAKEFNALVPKLCFQERAVPPRRRSAEAVQLPG